MPESRPGARLLSPPAAGRSPTALAGAWCQFITPPAEAGVRPLTSESATGAGVPSPPAAGRSPTATVGAWCQCITPPAAGRSPPASHRVRGQSPTLLPWAGAHSAKSSMGPSPRSPAHGPCPTAPPPAQGPQSHSPNLRAAPSRFKPRTRCHVSSYGPCPAAAVGSESGHSPTVSRQPRGPPYSGRWGQVPRIVPQLPGRSSRCSP